MKDNITISRLRIPVYIGVPDEERASPQDIEVTLSFEPQRTLFGTQDQIEATIDYYSVSQLLVKVAQEKPRKLIEQLNEELLEVVFDHFPIKSATITTYKFIIPETEYVSISMSRQGSDA